MQAAQWHLRAIGWAGLRDPMASIRHALQIVELDADFPNDADGDRLRLSARLYVTTMGWRVGADPADHQEGLRRGRPHRRADRQHDGARAPAHGLRGLSPDLRGTLAESVWIAMEATRLADALGDPGVRVLEHDRFSRT